LEQTQRRWPQACDASLLALGSELGLAPGAGWRERTKWGSKPICQSQEANNRNFLQFYVTNNEFVAQ
jgi:hypothetical protein